VRGEKMILPDKEEDKEEAEAHSIEKSLERLQANKCE
jgi:hypothetical protein